MLTINYICKSGARAAKAKGAVRVKCSDDAAEAGRRGNQTSLQLRAPCFRYVLKGCEP